MNSMKNDMMFALKVGIDQKWDFRCSHSRQSYENFEATVFLSWVNDNLQAFRFATPSNFQKWLDTKLIFVPKKQFRSR